MNRRAFFLRTLGSIVAAMMTAPSAWWKAPSRWYIQRSGRAILDLQGQYAPTLSNAALAAAVKDIADRIDEEGLRLYKDMAITATKRSEL